MSEELEPDVTIIRSKGQTIEEWPDDAAAAVAALRGCQSGLGGMFPNGTAIYFTSSEDVLVHERRREHLNRLAEGLASGAARIVWEAK